MDQKRDFIVNLVFYALIIFGIYALFEYITPIMMPFIIAFLVSAILRKPINYFYNKGKISKKIVSIVVLILFYISIGTLILLLVIGGISFVSSIANAIPDIYKNLIEPAINELYLLALDFNEKMTPDIQAAISEVLESIFKSLREILTTLSTSLVTSVTSWVTAVPSLLVSMIISIIASFFISADYDMMCGFLSEKAAPAAKELFDEIKKFFVEKILVVIRSYFLIMCLTFVELTVLFTLFGFNNPIWIAAGIAIFDILPVLGAGGIILPWSLISFIVGDFVVGLQLAIVYIVITVIRNIVEPKVVGAELGLHPVVTLATMLLGVRLFGVFGLFGFPIALSFLLHLKNKKEGKNIQSA